MSAVERLGQLLANIHDRAVKEKATEVIVDLTQLEFMNSACFKKLVTWITHVEAVPAANRYRIRFKSNPQMHWQRRSLHALHCFAMDVVLVEI